MNLKKKRKGGEECKQEIDEIQKQCEIKSTRPRKRERKESGVCVCVGGGAALPPVWQSQ